MGKGCKVVVCGLLSVGKTAILEQLLYGNHTIGMEDCETMEDVYMASVETDRGVKEQLHLYDTRGLQEGVELPKHYFSFADGFVLVYSVNNLESFQRVELLKKEIDKFKDKKEPRKYRIERIQSGPAFDFLLLLVTMCRLNFNDTVSQILCSSLHIVWDRFLGLSLSHWLNRILVFSLSRK
ncbi:NF-kappa-B inhibitor-interacting Ras-like protein 1 isoform X2 [Mirounga angustirostris]|uniref:NF-kappa-B inhibitor-interacting Ras-like protein 1 isoform X2 n=1 Tax=Mirounga angustirostris TaxID=9716 RepID=UPI001E6894AC|nr:NF-kappa-B inhibitor-interacting Ras-like protein 1 isoform X2 [Mirounga angustirostris]